MGCLYHSTYSFKNLIYSSERNDIYIVENRNDEVKKPFICKVYGDEEAYYKELQFLQLLQGSPFIIELYDFDNLQKILILEYVETDLFTLTYTIMKDYDIPEIFVKNIIYQLINGVKSIHKKNIIHRDIKLENILYSTKTSRIKIIDFDLSTRFYSHIKRKLSFSGSEFYIAPELLSGNYDYKVDVWSIGVVFYSLLYKEFPYDTVFDENLPEIEIPKSRVISESCKSILKKMLKIKPTERISLDEALEDEWFNNSDF